MKRRSFLTGAAATGAVAAAAAASSFPKPAISQGRKQLKMVTSWPKNFPGLGTAANRLSARVAAASDGRYTIKVFAGGELVHPLKCNDAVQQGTADMYHSADYYYGG
ncbi:MAG: twin-arginine translocation signal domain-containing protein, partial [Pseudomonadota bacterium]